MKIKNNIKKMKQFFAVSAAVVVALSGVVMFTQKASAAELPEGSLISSFLHPGAGGYPDPVAGATFNFMANTSGMMGSSAVDRCEFSISTSGSGAADEVDIVGGTLFSGDVVLTEGYAYSFTCYTASGDYETVSWLFGTPNPDKPTAPTLVAGYPKLNADGSVTLKWNPSTDSNGIARYDILVNNGVDASNPSYSSTVINLDGSVSEYTLPHSAYSSWDTSASNKLNFMIYVYDNHTPVEYNYSESVSFSLKSDSPTDGNGSTPSGDDGKNLIAPNTGFKE